MQMKTPSPDAKRTRPPSEPSTRRPFAVITACNAKYGDYLVDHWLASLVRNIDRTKVDIVVLDYGLTAEQRSDLLGHGVRVVPFLADGHVVNIRFRDMQTFLREQRYEQVLSCDGGDILFQQDITHLFTEHAAMFRVVSEDADSPLGKMHQQGLLRFGLDERTFPTRLKRELITTLHNKQLLNAGVVLAPRGKLLRLCAFIERNTANKAVFGPDQFLLNVYLHRRGFVDIGSAYNFIPVNASTAFRVRRGVIEWKHGAPIPIVHNAGRFDTVRIIDDFGYGPDRNKVKPFHRWLLRVIGKGRSWRTP
jgi:hypothetical protein